jgi:hypothetical protein
LLEAIIQLSLAFSLSGNAYLLLTLRRLKKQPPKKLDITAQELLHDLTRKGSATVQVSVIDSSKFLLWRGGE